MTVGKCRVIRFSVVNGRDAALEFPVRHCPDVTADERFSWSENIRTGDETFVSVEPLQRARSGSVALRVAIARPGRGISGLGVVVPHKRFFAVLGALIGPVGVGAAYENQCQQDG